MFVTFFKGDQTVQCALNEEALSRFRNDFENFRNTGFPLGGAYYDDGIEAEFFVTFQTMNVAEVTDRARPKMRPSPIESTPAADGEKAKG